MEILAGPAYVVHQIGGEDFEIGQHSPSSILASNVSKVNIVLGYKSLTKMMSWSQ